MLLNLLLNNFIVLSSFFLNYYPQTNFPESEPLARPDEKFWTVSSVLNILNAAFELFQQFQSHQTPLNVEKMMFHHGGLAHISTGTVADENKSELEYLYTS